VSVSRTTSQVGETVQWAVAKKTWLGTEALAHPQRTEYITDWESMAVVEPDGSVTAVGAWGEAEETTNVMAFNGKQGTVRFSLRAVGPGPSLDFVAEAPPVTDMRTAACCSMPVRLAEGQQLRFRVLSRDIKQTDVTHRSSGTR
jgi:hypothetical protein